VALDAWGLVLAGGRVPGVRLADGTVLPCDVAVNAGGPWSARVAAFAGIDLPIRARKRMIYVFQGRAPSEGSGLVIDPEGIFFRPEGAGFICGRSPGEGEPDPDEPPLEVEEARAKLEALVAWGGLPAAEADRAEAVAAGDSVEDLLALVGDWLR
jgi:glycine/D-amino acid oxidase-like deaminating enzyme